MVTLKNKKGFTLIELLAVIVVLGIVMVIGATTVLPLLEQSKKNAFETEAKSLISGASDIVTLITINEYEGSYYETSNDGYCITFDQIKTAGFWNKNDSKGYVGKVEATKKDNNYTYTVTMHNDNYKVAGASDGLTAENYVDTDTSVVYTCSGTLKNAS